jgi:hypothetical protein
MKRKNNKLKKRIKMDENYFSKKPFILKDSNGSSFRTHSSDIKNEYPDGIKQLFKYLGID